MVYLLTEFTEPPELLYHILVFERAYASLHYYRDGRPPDFFFLLSWKKKPEPGKLTIFYWRKNGGMMRHYCRPATHPDLIRISRFFSTKLEVSRFPDSTCENPSFLFCFQIGKTKSCLTLSHVPCLQAHKVWAKHKFYDRLLLLLLLRSSCSCLSDSETRCHNVVHCQGKFFHCAIEFLLQRSVVWPRTGS